MHGLLIYSSVSQQEHVMRVHNVLERFRAAGRTLNAKKCQFGKQSIKFLGHMTA